ncbi:MAG: GGDEF domain-containing protein [Streptococcus sp.]
MVIDIDDFKNINEIYDRSFGDFIIKTVAQLTQAVLPGNTSIYKLDSDQMGLLIENSTELEITKLYNEIQKQLLHEQLLKRYKCPIQISAGCAIYPKDGLTYNELNKYADYSLQYAKDNGKIN